MLFTKSFSSNSFLHLEPRSSRDSGLENTWVTFASACRGVSSDSWSMDVLPTLRSFTTWSAMSDTRGKITIMQGRQQLSLLSENCSRIADAHNGSDWKIADIPNPIGTVTKQSRPSKMHRAAVFAWRMNGLAFKRRHRWLCQAHPL